MADHSSSTTHSRFMQHHFVDADQQFEAAKMGMWIFLVTEILMFGGLFAAYIVFRLWYPDLFTQASTQLNTFWGGVNTVVLIGSSLTVAMAIKSAQLNQKKNIAINLGITLALAAVFMVIKYFSLIPICPCRRILTYRSLCDTLDLHTHCANHKLDAHLDVFTDSDPDL